MGLVCFSSAALAVVLLRPGTTGFRSINSLSSREALYATTILRRPFSKRKMKNACSAAHSLAAFSTSVSSTGCKSNAERLITLRTSLVAVC